MKAYRVLTGEDLPQVIIGIQIGSSCVYMLNCQPLSITEANTLAQVRELASEINRKNGWRCSQLADSSAFRFCVQSYDYS